MAVTNLVNVLLRSLGTPHTPVRTSGYSLGEAGCSVITLVSWKPPVPVRRTTVHSSLPTGSFKSALVGIFMLWNLANSTNQGFFSWRAMC